MLDIRKIYYYLVSFISLLIVLFALQGLLSTTLQTFVFKTNEGYFTNPPFISSVFGNDPYYTGKQMASDPYITDNAAKSEEIINGLKDAENLTAEQLAYINRWVNDYKIWEQDQMNFQKGIINSITANLISIIIFTPVFFYHFKQARKKD
jgi:hypothetical protein